MKYANISIERGYAHSAIRFGKDKERKINIGDYAQILAVDNLYCRMGIPNEEIIYIEYYDLFDYDGEYVILPINFIFFNAFYGERDFILSSKIIPVFLGIHVINGNFKKQEWEYFRKYSPIGCRDAKTLKIFREQGIDAYLQGCITSTFPKRNSGKYNKIYLVDAPKTLEKFMPDEIAKGAIIMSQEIYGDIDAWLEKEDCHSIKDYMKKRLYMYQSTAALVVTSRLHCAVPCMAMGIPTIFACEQYSSSYAWLESIIPVYGASVFKDIDWYPKGANYEDMKEQVLQYAIHRIKHAYKKYYDMCTISSFFEKGASENFKDAYTWRLEKYGEEHWKKEEKINYIVWGVTQITDEVCDYMDRKYPNSKLVAVIDDYREIFYRGLKSMKSDIITSYPECYFIGTGNSSSSAAQKKFAELGWTDRLCTVFGKNYEKN
jgi:hypothetical protein